MNKIIESFLNIALTHIKRLQLALDRLKPIMPITEKGVENMDEQELMCFELLTSRFSKLQDYLGSKIFDLFLEAHRETTSGMSMIDKLNRLEKIGIIDSVAFWDELRDLRNHLTHEYPNHPELTAKYLNLTYNLAPQLIKLTEKIINDLSIELPR